MYGFHRVPCGRDRGGYYHECFVKDNPDLCHRIQRIPVRGTKVRGASHPGPVPDFYTLPQAVCISDCDCSVASDATNDDVEKQPSDEELESGIEMLSETAIFNEAGACKSVMALEDSMETIIDDLLADLDTDDCSMIADFCTDWAPATKLQFPRTHAKANNTRYI
jgi:hypothetical protein